MTTSELTRYMGVSRNYFNFCQHKGILNPKVRDKTSRGCYWSRLQVFALKIGSMLRNQERKCDYAYMVTIHDAFQKLGDKKLLSCLKEGYCHFLGIGNNHKVVMMKDEIPGITVYVKEIYEKIYNTEIRKTK